MSVTLARRQTWAEKNGRPPNSKIWAHFSSFGRTLYWFSFFCCCICTVHVLHVILSLTISTLFFAVISMSAVFIGRIKTSANAVDLFLAFSYCSLLKSILQTVEPGYIMKKRRSAEIRWSNFTYCTRLLSWMFTCSIETVIIPNIPPTIMLFKKNHRLFFNKRKIPCLPGLINRYWGFLTREISDFRQSRLSIQGYLNATLHQLLFSHQWRQELIKS